MEFATMAATDFQFGVCSELRDRGLFVQQKPLLCVQLLQHLHMNEPEYRNDFNGKLLELSKLIKSWNLFEPSSIAVLHKFAAKILDILYSGENIAKIKRIIESELCITYGLYETEFDSEKLTNGILTWWSGQ